jgi:hypothetical protein
MPSFRPLAVLASAALVVTLVGCTGGSDAASENASTAGGKLTHEDSPLKKYLDAAWSGGLSEEEAEKQQADDMEQMEEIIAKCMTEEGFEYLPVAPPEDDAIVVGDDWDTDDREWVEKYGYGVMDFPGNDAEPSTEPEDESSSIAQNAEYMASLSESELAAYDEALYGPPVDDAALEDPDFEYNWQDFGCAGRAQHEVQGENPLNSSEFTDLLERISTFSDGVAESPEQQALDAEWAACMTEAGESGFTRQAEAQESIFDAIQVPEEVPEKSDTEAPEGSDTEALEESETEVPDDKSLPDTPETEALRQREIELALIDLTCREKTDYGQASLKIQFALEEQFIEDNKTELDAFKLAAEQTH